MSKDAKNPTRYKINIYVINPLGTHWTIHVTLHADKCVCSVDNVYLSWGETPWEESLASYLYINFTALQAAEFPF